VIAEPSSFHWAAAKCGWHPITVVVRSRYRKFSCACHRRLRQFTARVPAPCPQNLPWVAQCHRGELGNLVVASQNFESHAIHGFISLPTPVLQTILMWLTQKCSCIFPLGQHLRLKVPQRLVDLAPLATALTIIQLGGEALYHWTHRKSWFQATKFWPVQYERVPVWAFNLLSMGGKLHRWFGMQRWRWLIWGRPPRQRFRGKTHRCLPGVKVRTRVWHAVGHWKAPRIQPLRPQS